MAVALGLLLIPSFFRDRALSRAAKPALVIDALEHDFGRVPQNGSLEYRFHLTNRASRAYDILRVKGCCGLETTLEGGKHVKPGESRAIKIRTWASYAIGKARRTAEIDTNDRTQHRIVLALLWQVVARVTPVPASIDLGEVVRGHSETRSVDLWNLPPGFEITRMETTSPALKAFLVQLPDDALYRRVRIRLASAGVAPGELHGEVRVSTNDPIHPRVSIPIQATILDDLEIHPSQLSLGLVGTRPSAVAETVIAVRSPDPPRLRILRCSSHRYRLALRLGSDHRSYRLTLACRGPLPSGRLADVVELRAGMRTVRVPITGYVDPVID